MNVKNTQNLHVYIAVLCRINRDDETIRHYFRLAGELNIAPGTVLILCVGRPHSVTSAVRRYQDPTSSKRLTGGAKKQTLNPARKRTACAAHEATEGGLSLPSMLRRWVVETVRTDGIAAPGVVVARADRENLFVSRNKKRERRKQQRSHTYKN